MMSFVEYLKEGPGRRVALTVIYRLNEDLFARLLGVLRGADNWDASGLSSREYLPWLKRFPPFKRGVPRAQTFRKVFFAFVPESSGTTLGPDWCPFCGKWCAELGWPLMERPCAAPKRQGTEAARCIFCRPPPAKQDLSPGKLLSMEKAMRSGARSCRSPPWGPRRRSRAKDHRERGRLRSGAQG